MNVLRRQLPVYLAEPQRRRVAYYRRILDARQVARDGHRNKRVVKWAVSPYPAKRGSVALPKISDISEEIVIVKRAVLEQAPFHFQMRPRPPQGTDALA